MLRIQAQMSFIIKEVNFGKPEFVYPCSYTLNLKIQKKVFPIV